MKLKCTTLLIAATFLLTGCSESENTAPLQKSPAATSTKTPAPAPAPDSTPATPAQEQKPTSVANQPAPSKKTEEEKLTQEVKSLADALAYEGDDTPRGQVEKEIREVLEAVMADVSEAEKNTNKQ